MSEQDVSQQPVQEENVEETPEVTPEEPVETPEPEVELSAEDEGGEVGNGQAEEEPKYEPNFSYKALREEKEFDEWIRPVITDKETEQYVRDLYQKAGGLEHIKSERDRLKDEYKTVQQKQQEIDDGLNVLSSYVQNNDFDSFFEALQISKEQIYKYALDVAERQNMTPEQKQAWEQQRYHQQRSVQLESEVEKLKKQYEARETESLSRELDTKLSQPEVSGVAQNFDSAMGREGAFRDEVIRRGQYYATVEGKQISTDQAVNEVLQFINFQANQSNQQAMNQPQQQQAAPQAKPVVQQQKQYIPNVQGSNASPARKTVTSIEDLHKIREQMLAQS